jgi:2-polyprenyl-6-methoxyphenol hydroxylase-like FAD-dependent oxidoreductase
MPNGAEGLRKMGYWETLQSVGSRVEMVQTFHDVKGLIKEIPLTDVWGFSRIEFLQSLASHIEEKQVSYLGQMIELNSERELIYNGRPFNEDQYDWILGCDGANSAIRRHLFQDAEIIDAPTYEINGCFDSPAFCEAHDQKLIKIVFDQPGLAVGFLPLKTGKVIWFMQLAKAHFPLPERNKEALQSLVNQILSKAQHPFIKDYILSSPMDPYLWKGRILLGVDQYVVENKVLLGDAAHLFLPFTSQGTNMAIEDVYSFTTSFETMVNKDLVAFDHFNNRREAVENVAFQGMEFAHLFSTENYEFMLNHIPLVFTK